MARSRRFYSRTDGYRMKKPVYACLSCRWFTQEGKVRECAECKEDQYLQHFDSQIEYQRYCELRLLADHGHITNLQLQPRFKIAVMTQQGTPAKGCTYVADFSYQKEGKPVIEDVKPVREEAQSDIFKLKKRLFEAAYSIPITIIAR